MRILFFYSHPFNPLKGGIERVTDILADRFIKAGNKVYYLCGKVDGVDLRFSMPVDRHYTLPDDGFFLSTRNIKFFNELICKNQIDVVINQSGMWPYPNPILGKNNVKYISVIHSMPSAEIIKQKAMYFSRASNDIRHYIKYLLKILLYPIYGSYLNYRTKLQVKHHYRYLIAHSDKVVVLSEGYIKELNQLIGYTAENVCCIHNPNTFPSISVDLTHKEKVILYVGRLDPIFKQPLILIKIWKRIHRDFPDWKLVFVGDGISRTEMQEYVGQYQIKRVFFEGAQQDVAEYYKRASIVALVSKCEGWGMALTEAMTYGCLPLCFSSYAASKDIIDDELNGFLIAPFSQREFAQKLKFIMSNESLRTQMATAALKKVKQFSPDTVVKKWMALLNM